MITPTLTPAYGRDYKTKKEVIKDIEANKDFIINDVSCRWHGLPCSPSNFKGQSIKFRYAGLTKVFVHTIK